VDKKTLPIVILLVAVIFLFWPAMEWLGFVKPKPVVVKSTDSTAVVASDSLALDSTSRVAGPASMDTLTVAAPTTADSVITHDTIIVTTNKYVVTMTSYGGGPVSLKLREHTYRNREQVEMLEEMASSTPEALFASGTTSTARMNFVANLPAGKYDATSGPLDIIYTHTTASGGQVIKRFHFSPDNYDYGFAIELPNLNTLGYERQYDLVWNTPLHPTEPDSASDYESMEAVAMMSKQRTVLDDYEDNKLNQSLAGSTDWAGLRAKYFGAVMIPRTRQAEGVFAKGEKRKVVASQGSTEARLLTIGLEMPFAGAGAITDSFTIFVGPLDYDLMKSYGNEMEDILGIGTTPYVGWIIKPFALAVLWLLPMMYSMIGNYGWVIILFALLIKLVTLPLSLKSFKSMQAMKDIQPKIDELKKKHKNNPQALNSDMMKLYKTAGVNPFSGCLPMLLQMPLFFGLFSVFRQTILLRDAPWFWFISDLSRGASGFTDPYIILVVFMVAFQFISQKLTMATNQQNKMLMYLLPLMFAFFFYKLAAGLVLYWASFSLFSLLDYVIFKRSKKNAEIQTV
jgi:YidC/Oxa1 family membrane protein insertase